MTRLVLPAVVPPPCEACGQVHAREGRATCDKHKSQRDDAGKLVPCTRYPLRGSKQCTSHGAATKNARAKAAEAVAAAEAQAAVARTVAGMGGAAPLLGALVDVPNPAEMLRELIGWSAGHVAFYRAQVQALGGAHLLVQGTRGVQRTERKGSEGGNFTDVTQTVTEVGPEVHLWLRKYDEERDRLARLCVDSMKIGLGEKVVELAKRDGARVAEAFAWVQRAAGAVWDLDPTEVETFRGFLLTALSCLASGAEFPDPTVIPGQVVPAVGS